MYRVENPWAMLRARRALRDGKTGARIPRTVVLLGLCSLLTDISSEMVATVLPLYLVATLGFTPLQFGVVDGLYQGAGAFVRLGAGYVGDRFRRHKEVAVLGYGISSVCKLALATVGSEGIEEASASYHDISQRVGDALMGLAGPGATRPRTGGRRPVV